MHGFYQLKQRSPQILRDYISPNNPLFHKLSCFQNPTYIGSDILSCFKLTSLIVLGVHCYFCWPWDRNKMGAFCSTGTKGQLEKTKSPRDLLGHLAHRHRNLLLKVQETLMRRVPFPNIMNNKIYSLISFTSLKPH